jgi:hypothetical protein
MISLIFGYFLLKVMTREARERHTKHREVSGASGSSRVPSAQPKQPKYFPLVSKFLGCQNFLVSSLVRILGRIHEF